MAMRSGLRGHLEGLKSTRSWEHITDQIGMFCYTGLTQEEVCNVCGEARVCPRAPCGSVARLQEARRHSESNRNQF